jgi:hypothetical protein
MDFVDVEISPHVDIYTLLVVVLPDHEQSDFHVHLENDKKRMSYSIDS